jgi:MFS family permease
MSAVHGLVLSGWATAGLISPLLFGYLYDIIPNNSSTYVFYISATVLILSSIIVFSLTKLHNKCLKPV